MKTNKIILATIALAITSLAPQISQGATPNESGSISGIAFKDENNNGILDSGEKILANTEILLKKGGQTIKTTTSNNQGGYSFQNVPFGEYEITISSLEGSPKTSFLKVESFETTDIKTQDGLNKEISISGKATPDSRVEIEIGGTTYSTTANNDGDWSLSSILSNPKEGTYSVLGESIKGDLSSGKIIISSFDVTDKTLLDRLSDLRNNPEIQKAVKENVVPATAAAAIISTTAVSSSISFAQIIWSLWSLISSILTSLGLKKKEKDWGLVYDSVTRKPIKLAIVRIFNGETEKLMTTKITDENGRFGIILNPGNYLFSATKRGYVFPSKIEIDDIPNVYKGGAISITTENINQLNVDIPLDPIGINMTQRPLNSRIWYRFLDILRIINPYILFAGLLVSISATYLVTTWYNILILVIYVFLIIVKYTLIGKQKRAMGKVFNAKNKEGIEGAIVQIFDSTSNRLKETVITDRLGRFKLIAEPGEYQLNSKKPDYQFPSHSTYRKDEKIYNNPQKTIHIKTKKDSVIKAHIPMDKVDHKSTDPTTK